MIDVKICGLGGIDDMVVAAESGARWGGFVFYPPSPRHLSLEAAAMINTAAINKSVKLNRVALTVDAENTLLNEIIDALAADMIQCHGSESPDRIEAIKSRFGLPVMKALPITGAGDIEKAMRYDQVADYLLFDSKAAHGDLPGGRGQEFDWPLLKAFKGQTPWLLAGGLDQSNLKTAIEASSASAVDVSSGVESTRGIKDHTAIRNFIKTARGL